MVTIVIVLNKHFFITILLVVKTRAQLNTGSSSGIVHTITTMIKTEGPGSLYRGILPPIMVEAPKRATKFAANEQYTSLYKKLFGFEKVTQSLSVLTGISAGLTEAVIIVPFELVKVRMQDKANVSKKEKKEKIYFCVTYPSKAW